jgi:hypothetical protein
MNSSVTSSPVHPDLLARLEGLERQNRRMKLAGSCLLGGLSLAVALGWQGAPGAGAGGGAGKRISADEITCGIITAETFRVSTDKGEIRIDKNGITMSATGEPTGGRTNLTDHEARIEIGLDWDWRQDNALSPTPRVLVGRAGHDTSNNHVTRASILSPEGCHSGEWHTNNPKHDGRTDRELINELRRR